MKKYQELKQTFTNVRGRTYEKEYKTDHLEEGNVVASSLRGGKVRWTCKLCGRKFTSGWYEQQAARMKAWDCAESHS